MRFFGGAILAAGLGAWLSLGDLTTASDQHPDELRYSVVGLTGMAVVVGVVRKHALWLIPLATVGFARVYEEWFWTAPPGMPGGMDGIGWSPSDVIFAVPLFLLITGLMLGVARVSRRLSRRAVAT